MVSTLVRASVDGAVLVAAIWLVAKLLRLAPATRAILWWCAAAKFIVSLAWTAPIVIPVLPATASVPAVERPAAAAPGDQRSPAATQRRRAAAASPGVALSIGNGLREWTSFAAIGWTLGLGVAAVLGVRRWRDTVAMLRASVTAAEDVQAQAADLASRLGLRRTPEVRISSRAETPLVTGLVRPVVVLPADRVGTLSEDQQRMAICHELAHITRGDLWLGCVPALAERLFFFHPLVHVATREYMLAREAACDASVVRTLDAAPQEYGRLLLALGVAPSPGLTAAGAAWSFDHLKRRIAMLQETPLRRTRSGLVTAAIIGLAVVALVPLRLVARPAPAAPERPAPGSPRVSQRDVRPEATLNVEREDSPSEQAASTRVSSDGLRFVLFSEDGSRTTAGTYESDDVARAERQRRGNEALLWFRYDGKEYVVRDAEVLRQVRRAWRDVNRDFHRDGVRELTRTLESIDVERLAEHGARIAQSVDSAMIADQARLAAEIGQRAAEFGVQIAQDVLRGLMDGGVSVNIDEAKLEQHLRSLDKLDLDDHVRDIEKLTEHLGKDLEHSMKALEHQLHGGLDRQMKDLHEITDRSLSATVDQLRDLDSLRDLGEPMKEFGHRMGELGRDIGDAVREATDEMRAIIERSIAGGQARPIK